MKQKPAIVLWEKTTTNNVCTLVSLQQRKGYGDYLILKNDSGSEVYFFPDVFAEMAEIVMDKLQMIKESEDTQ